MTKELLTKTDRVIDWQMSDSDLSLFERDGFISKPNMLSSSYCITLKEEFERLFKGNFDKQSYPDEWYWREGISMPNATRHMSNAWKASFLIEELALNPLWGKLSAFLGGWERSRLVNDTLWWKPPGAQPIVFHQDASTCDCFTDKRSITIWITLTQTTPEMGTLEYIPGSHKWPWYIPPTQFHAPEDYRAPVREVAANLGIMNVTPHLLDLPAGSIAIHSGATWHGSGVNQSNTEERLSVGLHYIPHDLEFKDTGDGYIYRRYQVDGQKRLFDCFFPVV